MIKICKGVYIHYTTVMLFAVCWITRHLELLTLSYLTVFLHELAHLFSALLIGIEPSYIAFFPFGANLRIKSRIIYSLSDELILYMSGPLSNALLALFAQAFLRNCNYGRIFYWNNIGLFLFNMLPVMPLDGAVVAKRIISDKIGVRTAEKVLRYVSVMLVMLMISAEILFALKGSFNFPIVFVMIFLTANIFTNTEKYSMNFVKELIYNKSKRKKDFTKAEVCLVNEDYDERRLAERFNASKSYIIFKKNKKGNISSILSEEEIIDRILNRKNGAIM